MRFLVTGAAGFIGSHLVDLLLSKNHKVVGIDNLKVGTFENLCQHKKNKDFIFYEGDIADKKSVLDAMKDCDAVFHLAAMADIVPSINNPSEYFNSNVNGTFNVLEAAKKQKIKRFIYAASSSCYGLPDIFPTSESADIKPMYPYALTKRLGEELVMHWIKLYNIPGVSLRLFNVYGPRARTSGTYGAVFGVFLAQKLANLPFTVVGDGSQTRDFTYVSDVVDAFYTAMISDVSNQIFNVGSGGTYSINNLISLLGGEFINIPKRPGEPDCTFADITKIKKMLNWVAKVAFQSGVTKLLNEIDTFKDAPVWNKESIELATTDWFKYLGKSNGHK